MLVNRIDASKPRLVFEKITEKVNKKARKIKIRKIGKTAKAVGGRV